MELVIVTLINAATAVLMQSMVTGKPVTEETVNTLLGKKAATNSQWLEQLKRLREEAQQKD
ncbi:MAG: hypothetical protein IMZ55_04935 [Acidobacteria bacterium]|nr:hypothetical protein [Acidobacteriota bacterium]